MKSWYSISAKANDADTADLSIFDYIGAYGVEAATFIADLKAVEAKNLTVSINSPGGSVFDAIAIFNALRNSGKKITVRVLGIAASAASYIALAGDKRVMPENAMQMVHNASSGVMGNAEDMREMADLLDMIDANLQATYVARTGQTPEAIKELLSTDRFLTAAECLTFGLCDEVEPAIKMTAAFEVDRLPADVIALFTAAQEPAAVEPTEDEIAAEAARVAAEAEAAETARLAAEAEAAAAAEAERLAAAPSEEQVTALAAAAGVGDLVASIAPAARATLAGVQAALEDAKQIKALCALASMPTAAAELISAGVAPAAAGIKLCEMKAAADLALPIDTATKGKTPVLTATVAEPITTASLWSTLKSQARSH